MELLKLVISPPDTLPGISVPLKNKIPEVTRALALLDGHPTKIDPCRALAELPDTIPLAALRHYLIASLQQEQQERRTAQLLRGLLTTQKLHVCYSIYYYVQFSSWMFLWINCIAFLIYTLNYFYFYIS